MYGTEKLKSAIAFAINLAEAIEKKMDDGKISLVEGISLIPKLKELPGIISNAGGIKNEFLDLDEAEKVEVVNFVKTELDLENDKVEAIIEKSLECIAGLSNLITEVRAAQEDSVGGGGPGGDPDDGK